MLGAIVGDIVGSRFEGSNLKSKEFELFTDECVPTDDSNMTLAVAKALVQVRGDWGKRQLEQSFRIYRQLHEILRKKISLRIRSEVLELDQF